MPFPTCDLSWSGPAARGEPSCSRPTTVTSSSVVRGGRCQSARSPATARDPAEGGPAPEPSEVRVTGSRVLMHDGDAVLAVDERVRYGPLKAGYHGGAAPAEVVVPLHVLTPSEPPAGWALATPQQPLWWHSAVTSVVERSSVPEAAPEPLFPKSEMPTLFDETTREPVQDFVAQILATTTYGEQRKRAQRVTLTDDQIASLAAALGGVTWQPPRSSHGCDRAWTSRSCASAALFRWPSDSSTSSSTRSSTGTLTARRSCSTWLCSRSSSESPDELSRQRPAPS